MSKWLCGALSLLVVASAAAQVINGQFSTIEQFRLDYPDALLHSPTGRIERVYGSTFGFGDSPEATAERFRVDYAGLFGAEPEELLPIGPLADGRYTQPIMFDPETGQYKFTLLSYTQHRDGIPVFRSTLKLLVRNEPGYGLVWVGSTLKDLGRFAPTNLALRVDLAQQAALEFAPELISFGDPELVIYAGVDDKLVAPVTAVTFVGDNYDDPDSDKPQRWLFVADATTGVLLYTESLIIQTDVTGNVSGQATTGPKSDNCGPEAATAMAHARVTITGGNTAYADASGNFTIPNSGTSQVTVQSPMAGRYFTVDNVAGAEETLSLAVTPPGPANFMHNEANTSEQVRAQVNGYVQANVVRDWVLTYNPSYPTIAGQLNFPVYVNQTGGYCPGNAWYDGSSINFCLSGSGYPNTAWSSVVHHEYGHHAVQTGGSGQDAYGEGMGDCFSALIADDPILGYGFTGNCNTGIRTADNTFQYPCSGEIHYCGQLLSGCVWDLRDELLVTNPGTYRAIVADLTINSILMHDGGSITPTIYTDFLTLDDDNGNLGDGTPHYNEIYAAFDAHNMVPAPPPTNDACASAINACPGTPYTGDTSGATLDGSTSCGTANGTPDVWFKYKPLTSGSLTASLCTGTSYDSVMSIHSACPGSSGNTLNCDDDGCGGYSAPSTITRSVTAGTTYIIRISGWSGSVGSFTLNLTGPACDPGNYTLTVNVTGQGSVTLNPPGGTYPSGTTVQLTAVAAAHWHFDHWEGALSGSTNPTTILMNGNKTVTAVFAIDPTYSLDVGSLPIDGVTIQVAPLDNGGQGDGATPFQRTYWDDDNVTLTAPARPDVGVDTLIFERWWLNGLAQPAGQTVLALTVGANASMDADYILLGDMNCDDLVNSGDIPPFVMALVDRPGYEALYPSCDADLRGDYDGDGVLNAGDIPGFVNRLTGP